MKLYQIQRRVFPDPATQSIDGIVAMGDSLNVTTLFEAYSFGIFPWPHEDLPLLWYSPDPRGVLFFDRLHVSRSLRKFMRQMVAGSANDTVRRDGENRWRVTFNKAFTAVMKKCAEVPRPGQGGTWISSGMLKAYTEFHRAGYAHSVEVWEGDELVGGLYGVYVAGVFSGESMFFTRSNASKVALVSLVERLREFGLKWMDTQMLTSVTEQLGAEYISRDAFLRMLEDSKRSARELRL